MVLTKTPICNFGEKANTFKLKGTDGKLHKLEDYFGKNGILIMFICNHCPYVKDLIERLVEDFSVLQSLNFGTTAIMPNDTNKYPEDSYDKMKRPNNLA